MPLDYEKKYKDAYRTNVKDTVRAALSGELDKKINAFCRLHEFERVDVINEIQNNKMFAAWFAKNPNKQNIYEKLAAEYIESIPGVSYFRNLGNQELALLGGGVFHYKDIQAKNATNEAKKIDFSWVYSKFQFYATRKYTKEEGGSQSSAYRDVQNFISEANKSISPNTYFVAIADGPYYQQFDTKVNMIRMKRLEHLSHSKCVIVCTINELQKVMKKL